MDWVKNILKVKEYGSKLLINYKQNKEEYKNVYIRVASIALAIGICYILFKFIHRIEYPAIRFGLNQLINIVMTSAEVMLIICLIYFLVYRTVSKSLFIAESVVLALAVEFMLGTYNLLSMIDLRKELIVDQSFNNLEIINRITTIQFSIIIILFIALLIIINSLIHKYRKQSLNKV